MQDIQCSPCITLYALCPTGHRVYTADKSPTQTARHKRGTVADSENVPEHPFAVEQLPLSRYLSMIDVRTLITSLGRYTYGLPVDMWTASRGGWRDREEIGRSYPHLRPSRILSEKYWKRWRCSAHSINSTALYSSSQDDSFLLLQCCHNPFTPPLRNATTCCIIC